MSAVPARFLDPDDFPEPHMEPQPSAARITEAESVVTFPLTGLNLLLAVATVAAAIGLSYLGSLTS